MSDTKDWQNKPVRQDEKPEDAIWVWELEPAMDGSGGSVHIRGWQDALDYVRNSMECDAENAHEDELKDTKNPTKFTVSMMLVKTTLGEYESLSEM